MTKFNWLHIKEREFAQERPMLGVRIPGVLAAVLSAAGVLTSPLAS